MLKNFFGGNLDFPKIKKLKNICFDVRTCTKMWKQCYFNQNYAQKLFIAFKMAYSCCCGLRGNLNFPDFFQKKVYNIDYWYRFWKKEGSCK